MALSTGNVPGCAASNAATAVFGGAPYVDGAPLNSLLRVASLVWISTPTTVSYADEDDSARAAYTRVTRARTHRCASIE